LLAWKFRWLMVLAIAIALLLATSQVCLGQDGPTVEIQKYDRSIQVMAMLLLGFGFLMVFVRKYGRSALTATFLAVSVAIPLYMVLDSAGIFGSAAATEVDKLILAEFAGASLLICAGACLGRLKMFQYIILAILFIPLYMMNEWIILENGWGIISKGAFIDTGGSIVIHTFGALFGLGLVIAINRKKDTAVPIESDYTSDRFSMLGSMVLWVFWPSFCAALVPPELVPYTAINVVIALCGSTLATYFASLGLRRTHCRHRQCVSGGRGSYRSDLRFGQSSYGVPYRDTGRDAFDNWICHYPAQNRENI
jgi:ammonium transporter Rh